MGHLAASTLTNPVSLGILTFLLVMVPIIGIKLVHEKNNK